MFYTNNDLFTSIVNKDWPTQTEIDAIGEAAETPSGVRGNNGTLWAWYAQGHSAFNCAAPPNWSHPSAGGRCCPGGAHDWSWGLIPPRSMHPGGVTVAMGDGSVQFIVDGIDLLVFQRMGHRSDGQTLDNL